MKCHYVGIDVGAKAAIHQLMRRLASEGVGILMISSELLEIIGMSDRCIVMRAGRIEAEFSGQNLTEPLIMKAAVGAEVDAVSADIDAVSANVENKEQGVEQ